MVSRPPVTPEETERWSRMIRVLASFPRRGKQTNPYLLQLAENLPAEVTMIGWSWPTALVGNYDVLHLHWPEVLFRRNSRLRTAANQLLFLVLMLRVALTDVIIVRTVHNPRPHESGNRFERWLLRWCDHQTALRIALNATSDLPPGAPWIVIAHGHYRDAYDISHVPDPVREGCCISVSSAATRAYWIWSRPSLNYLSRTCPCGSSAARTRWSCGSR